MTRCVLWTVLGLIPAALAAQTPPPQPAEYRSTIKSGAQEVLLDLIVRDKKGRPVADLRAEDLEITDDGVPVTVRAFRLVDGHATAVQNEPTRTAPKPKITTTAAGADPMRQIRLVTLVFERLTVDGRRLFKQAVNDMLSAESSPNVYFAIFTIDQRLALIQPFTNDRALLKKAVEETISGAYSSFDLRSDQLQKQLATTSTQQDAAAASSGAAGRATGSSGVGTNEAAAALAQMQLSMLQFASDMDRQQQGAASIYPMMALVREQSRLPGRKIVMYFTETFKMASSTADQLKVLINAANRSNVSIYTVDARGLISGALNSEGLDLMSSAAASSRKQALAALSRQPQIVTRDQVRIFDTAQDAISANGQVGLDTLASQTGGFLISNSNDIRSPMRRALEEVLTYYEATYAPPAMNYDGHFRTISVKSRRPDLVIHARAGYFALPPTVEAPSAAYELPLLNALAQPKPVRGFEYLSGVHRFDPRHSDLEYTVTIETPIRNLTALEDKEKNVYRVHASVLALVKDQSGKVVSKLSRDLPFEGPLDKLPGFRNGNLIQTYNLTLHAGRYTLETAMSDRNRDAISARRSVLIVPASTTQLALSNLVIVRRLDPATTPEKSNPLYFEGGHVTPTLASALPAGPGNKLALYFTIYLPEGDPQHPELMIEIRKDGKQVGSAKPEIPAADSSGRIPYVTTISLDTFTPGNYEVVVSARQGQAQAAESASFVLE